MNRAEEPRRSRPGPHAPAARAEPDPALGKLLDGLRSSLGDVLDAVLLFGSRLVGSSPDPHSAYDLVVVVRSYHEAYRCLRTGGAIRRSPRLLSALARVLPPNVLSFVADPPGGPLAKCMVITRKDLERAVSPAPADHFLLGRLAQHVAVVHARDAEAEEWAHARLAEARRRVLDWAGPFLDESFDAASLTRRMLEVSYRGEVRPEAADRVGAVFEAQRHHLVDAYRALLEEEADRGGLVRENGAYRFADPPGRAEALRRRVYFARSKVRATARWFKHVLTFDDWLEYIARKVERRTGQPVVLTPIERRLPLILLWPRAIRILWRLGRARREAPPGSGEAPAGSRPDAASDPPRGPEGGGP